MHEVLKEEVYCWETIESKFNKPLRMRHIKGELFKTTRECYICGIKYRDNDIRVLDHCH